MAIASAGQLEDLAERLLNCEICTNFFNEESCLPFALPCHHSFCSTCIENVGSKGEFPCPLCRIKVPFNPEAPVSRQFPIERTLVTLLKWTRSLKAGTDFEDLRSKQNQDLEVCNRHSDEKKKYYCTSCKVPVCPSCALERHKDRDDHDIVSIQSVYEEAKKELLGVSGNLERVEKTARGHAETIKADKELLEASYKRVLEETDEHFESLQSLIAERKKYVLLRLDAEVGVDRRALDDQLTNYESLAASAQVMADFGKRVVSLGEQTEVVTELYNVRRSAAELSKRCRKPAPGFQYKIDSSNMLNFTQVLLHFGNINKERIERKEEKKPAKLAPPAAPEPIRKEEFRFVCPEFELDKTRCGQVCTVEGSLLTNQPSSSEADSASSPYPFPGTRGTVALTPDHVIYWQVKITVTPDPGVRLSGVCCEVGMAEEADLTNASGYQWLCETSPTTLGVLVSADESALQCSLVFEGDILKRKQLCPWDNRSPAHRTLGFLVDGPGSKCHVIDVDDVSPLGDVRVDLTTAAKWPVVHVNPRAHLEGEVTVELLAGEKLPLDRKTVNLLHSLLTGESPKEERSPKNPCPLQ